MKTLTGLFCLSPLVLTVSGCASKTSQSESRPALAAAEKAPETVQDHWARRNAEDKAEKKFEENNGPRK